MVSASWLRRKSSNRSACEPRAPRWTSEINNVRKRRSGHSSLIPSLPMRERLADFHDGAMTSHDPVRHSDVLAVLYGEPRRMAAGTCSHPSRRRAKARLLRMTLVCVNTNRTHENDGS